jgi:hypothetical protein
MADDEIRRLKQIPSSEARGVFYLHSNGVSFSHAEADNSVCTIAVRRAALKNWRSLTALTKRGDEHFVCLA